MQSVGAVVLHSGQQAKSVEVSGRSYAVANVLVGVGSGEWGVGSGQNERGV